MTTSGKRPPRDFKAMAAALQSGLDHGAVPHLSCDVAHYLYGEGSK